MVILNKEPFLLICLNPCYHFKENLLRNYWTKEKLYICLKALLQSSNKGKLKDNNYSNYSGPYSETGKIVMFLNLP